MSRALNEGVLKLLQNGNHETSFEQISAVLSQTSDSLLEIELLGQSHTLNPDTYFLQDGNAIAIPKLRLVQAFIFARQILTRYLQGGPKPSEQAIIRSATAVILLMDPEHLTAANTRKRLIADAPASSGDAAGLLLSDKFFIDSLLVSRLHRHTKSPTIWSHRRWLLAQLRGLGLATDAAQDLRNVVFVSAERHPRNYYAWCHARHLIDCVDEKRAGVDVPAILADTKKWCFGHHDDVSGWMFLTFLLGKWPAETGSVFSETLKLTGSFRWRNESVWYFLRYMMLGAAHVAGPQRDQFQSVVQDLRKDTQDNSLERKVLDEVSGWIKTYSAPSCT